MKRNDNGSISLYVLIACTFFIVILMSKYVSFVNKSKAIEEEIKQIQENYGNFEKNESSGNSDRIPITSITIDPNEKKIYVGETFQLNVTKVPQNATEGIQWTSNNDNIVSVSNTGLLTAKNIGTTTISAKGMDNSNVLTECIVTVERISIQTNEPYNVTYNGKEQKWVPIVTDINGKILTENIDYTVSYNTTNFIDAGEIEVTIIGQNNYVGTITKKYTIEKAPLKVTTSSASKVYDGYALTDSGIIIDGIVGDDEITANVTGSQTEVGASANPCEVEFKSGKDSNYNMEIQWGTLKVVAVAVGGGGNGITETNSDVFNVAVTSLGSLITFDGFDADGGYRVGDQIEFEASIDNTKYNQLLTDIVVQVGYKSKLNGSITVEAGDDYSINGDTVSISLVEPGVKKNIKFSYLVMAGDGGIKGSRKKYYAQMTAIKENLTKIYVYKETKEVLIEPEPDDGNG